MSLNFWKVNLFANEIKMTKNNTIIILTHKQDNKFEIKWCTRK